MAKTKKEKLIDKRSNAIRALQFYENTVKELDPESSKAVSYATITFPLIEANYEKCTKATEALEDLDDFEYKDLDPIEVKVTQMYVEMATKLKEILDGSEISSNSINATSNVSMNQNHHMYDLKLPPLEIPKFSGKFEEWTTFYDTFSVYVDQSSIPNVNKMHYLKKSLTGTAYRMLQNLPASDENYRIGWDLLCERFHNKRAIVNSCMRMLMEQESIVKPSAYRIRELIDTTNQAIHCIETLEVDTKSWDAILVYIIQTKMDQSTLKEWEIELKGSRNIPTYKNLMDFLETQYRIYDQTALPSTSNNARFQPSIKSSESEKTHENTTKRDECKICNGNHWLFFCPIFDGWTFADRLKYVNQNKLCKICLHAHNQETCRSKYKCKKCKGNHNTKLHDENMIVSTLESQTNNGNTKLFATAIVKVLDKSGNYHLLRAFIDSGSEGAVITEKAAQLLNLPKKRENIPLKGIDGMSLGKITSSVKIQVKSAVNESFNMSLEAMVKRSILSSRLHTENKNKWQHLQNISLADPEFLEANECDLLFGIDVYALIIEDGVKKGKPHEPIAQNSAFGWLVFGVVSSDRSHNISINTMSIDESLRRLWENEEVKLKPILSEEHQKCVEQCAKSTVRLPDGRIQVAMPFNMDPNDENFLGDSRKMALKRFFQLEKRFEKDPNYHKRYNEETQNYIDSGHMSVSKSTPDEGYYLPHHGIIKESSTTTKLRIVFDASAKTTNGQSLNDRCRNGPTIQPELFDTFIRWRTNKIALSADEEKMYRQFRVPPEDRKFLKILYRFSNKDPIQVYELNTVTFGVKSAPYMAIQSTFFLSDIEKDNFPEASKRAKSDIYVDDVLSGNHSVSSTQNLQTELNGLFNSAHIPLRKWASNDDAALNGVPPENRAINPTINLKLDESLRTLGMKWTPTADSLHFTIDMSTFSIKNRITKR